MTLPIVLFIGLSATLSVAILLYVANLLFVARHAAGSHRAWAVVPVLTPVVAWKLGARALPAAFVGVAALYGFLVVTAWAGLEDERATDTRAAHAEASVPGASS